MLSLNFGSTTVVEMNPHILFLLCPSQREENYWKICDPKIVFSELEHCNEQILANMEKYCLLRFLSKEEISIRL